MRDKHNWGMLRNDQEKSVEPNLFPDNGSISLWHVSTFVTSDEKHHFVFVTITTQSHEPLGLMHFCCLWKFFLCLLKPNCARNHVITKTNCTHVPSLLYQFIYFLCRCITMLDVSTELIQNASFHEMLAMQSSTVCALWVRLRHAIDSGEW